MRAIAVAARVVSGPAKGILRGERDGIRSRPRNRRLTMTHVMYVSIGTLLSIHNIRTITYVSSGTYT